MILLGTLKRKFDETELASDQKISMEERIVPKNSENNHIKNLYMPDKK